MEQINPLNYQNHISSSESEDDSFDPPIPERPSLSDTDFLRNLMKKIDYKQGKSLHNPLLAQAEKTGLYQPDRIIELTPVFLQVFSTTYDREDLNTLANGIANWKTENRIKLFREILKRLSFSKFVPFLTTLLNLDMKTQGLNSFIEAITRILDKEDIKSYSELLLHVFNTNLVLSILNNLGRNKLVSAEFMHQLIANILKEYGEESHKFFAEKEKGKKKKIRLEILTEGWESQYEQSLLGILTQKWTRKQLKKNGISHHMSKLPKEFSLKAICALKIIQLSIPYSDLPKELKDFIDRQRELEYYKYFEKKKVGNYLPCISDEENASDLSDYLSDSEGENWRNILSKDESDKEDSLIEKKQKEPVSEKQLLELRRAGQKQKYWSNLMLYYQRKEEITLEVEMATKFSKFEEFVRQNKILGNYEQFRNWMNQRLGTQQRKRKLEEIEEENRWSGKRQKVPDFNWFCSKCGKKKYFVSPQAVLQHAKNSHKGLKVQAIQDLDIAK